MEDRVSCIEGIADAVKEDHVCFIAAVEEIKVHSDCYFTGEDAVKMRYVGGLFGHGYVAIGNAVGYG